MFRVGSFLIGYLFGLFQTSYIYGKSKGIDIRSKGSGNAGMTNTMRVFGGKIGALVLLCDALKCILAVIIARAVFCGEHPDLFYLVGAWAAFGAVIGHVFPFYMNFRGGKGVACTCGAGFITSIPVFIISMSVFMLIELFTGYVSLGSLLASLTFLVTFTLFDRFQLFGITDPHYPETAFVIAAIVAVVWIRHRSNIVRLVTGKERRTYWFRKKTKKEEEA